MKQILILLSLMAYCVSCPAFAGTQAQSPVGLRYAIHEKTEEALSADNTTLASLLSLRIAESILLDTLDTIDAQLLNETSSVIVDGLLKAKRAILLDLHNNSIQHISKVNQWKPNRVQKLLVAQSLNNSFSSSVPFQQYEKTVCAIFLNMALQEREASTAEKSLLTPIASLCPKVGGPAVFFAPAHCYR